MQEVSSSAAEKIDENNIEPVLVLKLLVEEQEYYFASEGLQLPYVISGKLLRCSGLEEKTSNDLVGGAEKITLEVSDINKTFFDVLQSGKLEGITAEVLQCFNNSESSFPVFSGIVSADSKWQECSLQIVLNGLSAAFDKQKLLRLTNRKFFPQIMPEDQGICIPLSFGKPKRVKATRVGSSPVTTLAVMLDIGDMEFYVSDASNFPSGEIILKVNDEYISGSFSGNRFTVTKRGDYHSNEVIAGKCGNSSIIKIKNPINLEGDKAAGLYARIIIDGYSSEEKIIGSTEDGVINIKFPFTDEYGMFYQPIEDDDVVIFSKVIPHNPGASVRLADESAYYIINDAPVDSVILIEGVVKSGFCRIPQSLYSLNLDDNTTFAALNNNIATLKLHRLPQRINNLDYNIENFTNDDIYVTMVAQNSDGNPVDIIRTILESAQGVTSNHIDNNSFINAANERANHSFSFSITKNQNLIKLINDLCFQARLSLLWQRGKFKLVPIYNGINSIDRTLNADDVISYSYLREADADEIDGIEAQYRGGVVCVYKDDNVKNNIKKINLWAYESYEQVQAEAHWWLRRLSAGWQKLMVQTYLSGSILQRNDVVELLMPAESVHGFVGVVEAFKRLPIDDENKIEICEIELAGPSWLGCSISCETTCEVAGCESAGCEMSCTASCELACQSTCENTTESFPVWYSKGCRKTCQISCRSSGESGCDSTACETGCEVSCEGASFEAVCPSGCETAQELGSYQQDSVISVTVVSAPTSVGGEVIVTSDKTGESITAIDVCNLRPASGSKCMAIKSESDEWYIADAGREAKFVKVLSDLGGGQFSVIESDISGATWGTSFIAQLP